MRPAKRAPEMVERGEDSRRTTPRSWHPNGFGSVGVLRVRPLPRGRVNARREAPIREEKANQRWYRDRSPSARKSRGRF